jgi:hypothetical protein
MDEHKLIKFNMMRKKEINDRKRRQENALNLRNKLFTAAEKISPGLMPSDSDANIIKSERLRIEEEDKERDVGTFMVRNTQRRDLEKEFAESDDYDTTATDDALSTPLLRETPFLYLGFGINLYFNFQLIMILTMGIISILCIPIYKIMGSREFYPVESWDVFSLGNFGSSKASCSSSSLMADNFGAH